MVLTKQHMSTFCDFTKVSNFHEVVIRLASEHFFGRRHFMTIVMSGACGANPTPFYDFRKKMQK